MFKTPIMASLVSLLAAAPALAQIGGGEIPWNWDPQSAIKQAKEKGIGMMLYFTSEG